MRKFLSSTAGATFNQEVANETICVRKDCVELIYKVKPSVYVIVSMLHVGDSEAMLFMNWANYFDRLANPHVQMPRIEKCCPTLYAVMTGDDPNGVYECCYPGLYHVGGILQRAAFFLRIWNLILIFVAEKTL